jgi:exonuclease III
MKCITWNLKGIVGKAPKQMDAVIKHKPDIVAFQEVTINSVNIIRKVLSPSYSSIVDSFELAGDKSVLVGPRQYGELIATNFKVKTLSPQEFDIPWQERVLSVNVHHPKGIVEFHNAYIPPGSTNRWKKIETLEGIYERLAIQTGTKRILCGDFNTPQDELSKYGAVTFAQKINKLGVPKLKKTFRGGSSERWDKGERDILEGLREYNLIDSYRQIHHIPKKAFSFELVRKGRIVAQRRFDHFFSSKELHPKSAEYLHELRKTKLSDHSPLVVQFKY